MNAPTVLNQALEAVAQLTQPEPPWRQVLDAARRLVGGDSATLLMFGSDGTLLVFENTHASEEATRDYSERFHALDIVRPEAAGRQAGTWLDTQALFSPSQLSGSAYYVDFMCRYRMRQMMTLLLYPSSQQAGLTVQREHPATGDRRAAERPAVRQFTTALLQALARRREAARDWLTVTETAFYALDEALCLSTIDGEILYLTPKGESLLHSGSALCARRGRLWHPDGAVRDALTAALRQTALPGPARAPFAVPGSRGAPSFTLDLVRADPRLRFAGEALVLIRMRRHPPPGDVPLSSYCAAFGITAAEARVLDALIRGQSPAEHAVVHGVSVHTVRKQIATLMDKMQCRRQVDLVRTGMNIV